MSDPRKNPAMGRHGICSYRAVVALCAIVAMAAHAMAAPLALIGGNILDVKRHTIIPRGVILIEGDRIARVGRAGTVDIPASAQVMDCSGKWLIPGLVDAHIHLFQSGGLYTRPDGIDLRRFRPYEVERAWVQANAGDFLARHLAAGVTTVVDVGGPLANYAIRDHFNQEARSPAIFLTGPLISTWRPEEFAIADSPFALARDPAAARELVRQQLPYKPDLIKILYVVKPELPAESTAPIVRAAIAEAHAHGLKAAVHSPELESSKLGLRAGADILVHSVKDAPVDAEFIALVKKGHVANMPTLTVGRRSSAVDLQTLVPSARDFALGNPFSVNSLADLKHLPAGSHTPHVQGAQLVLNREKNRLQNLKTLTLRGALVTVGTDAGNPGSQHGSSYVDELLAMREAGLSNWQLLEDATLHGAMMLGREAEFGTLEARKLADVVVLDSNPVENLENVQTVHRVIHRGAVFTPAELVDHSPVALVQRQLAAYNFRNIDAFLAPYSENVEVSGVSGELQYSGKERMRAHYAELFASNPELHGELVNRIASGSTVIDQERVTGVRGGPMEIIALYTVTDGEISGVRFHEMIGAGASR